MIKINHSYGNRSFDITPYTTAQEKDFLLLGSLEDTDLDSGLKILNIANDIIDSLHKAEKIALLFKHRSVSVGDELNIKYTCSECKQVNESQISIGEMIIPGIPDEDVIDQYKPLTDDNLQDFVKFSIDEMDLDEYDLLRQRISNAITKFDFLRDTACIQCKTVKYFDISKDDNILDSMSDDSLMSIYQLYNDLTFHGKYSKLDIDSMYPFERTIFVGLLNKTREELNQ
mgnify:CR=1 FL=1|jgi:hypothetical protein